MSICNTGAWARNRIATFFALKLLIAASERPPDDPRHIDPADWTAKDVRALPSVRWSPEQQAAVDIIERNLEVCDANVSADSRILLITGGPGTGKTEVVVHCASSAAAKGAKVLIACPVGALVDEYRSRLPPSENLVVETVHASFRITRKADQAHIPPGRLRHFDLIFFDEGSQLDAEVWKQVKTACGELSNGPSFVFLADFQQLQLVRGAAQLQDDLGARVAGGSLRHIELRQHEAARNADPVLLDFLRHIRRHQPSKGQIPHCFGNRRLPQDPRRAVAAAMRLERAAGRRFTFLTVTNRATHIVNAARLAIEFPAVEERTEEDGVPTDPELGGGRVVFVPGRRVRLTRNLDKDRGFVNGAPGVVEHVLRKGSAPSATFGSVSIRCGMWGASSFRRPMRMP